MLRLAFALVNGCYYGLGMDALVSVCMDALVSVCCRK